MSRNKHKQKRKTKTMMTDWYNNSYSQNKPKKARPIININDHCDGDQFYSDLYNVLGVQSYSGEQQNMVNYILKYIKDNKIPCDYYLDEGNIYITKGKADVYPCVVAHMDTVHRIVKGYKVYKHDDCYFAWAGKSQTGIGGDDKVGVFIALQMLIHKANIKIVFFRDEEVGMQGSKVAQMTFFEDVGYAIQCDRRGNDEVITNGAGTALCSEVFIDSIKGVMKLYGYRTSSGSYTDVVQLKNNGLEACVVNLGCGYYNPHSSSETVIGNDVVYVWLLVQDMIDTLGEKFYEHKKPVFKYTRPRQSAFWSPTKYIDKANIVKIEKDEFQEDVITLKDHDCKHCDSDRFYVDFNYITCARCHQEQNISIDSSDNYQNFY